MNYYSVALVYGTHIARLLISWFYCVRTAAMSHARNFCLSSQNIFAVVMRVKKVPFACMNPVLNCSWNFQRKYSDIFGYRQFSHNILYENVCMAAFGMCWMSFAILPIVIQWRKFKFFTTAQSVYILLQSFENIRFSHYFLVNFLGVACHVKSSRVPLWARVP